jgi:anti-sigma factor RsiW
VSLFLHRGDVEAAVAGTLGAAEEASLRAHLSTCDDCRTHYDALTLAARTLGGTTEPTLDELRRERARLEASLQPAAVKPKERRPFAFILLPIALAAAVALVVFIPRDDGITERGGDDVRPPFTISVYAKAKEGTAPVRLAAELPSSGEATVSANEWVQVSSKSSAVVVAVGESGVQVFEPGGSLSFTPGTWRVFAVTGASVEEVNNATKGLTPSDKRLPLAKPQVTGVLSVQP